MKADVQQIEPTAAMGQKLLACVHCGLCLEACPTYVQTGDENDGPRGRIYLMRAVEEGRLARESETFRTHIARCLGCRACESACPAGVEYGQLLEVARERIAEVSRPRGLTSFLLNFSLQHVWPYPKRLRLAFLLARALRDSGIPRLLLNVGVARLLPKRVSFSLALLAASARPAELFASTNERTEANGTENNLREGEQATRRAETRATAQLFKGCVTDVLFKRVSEATARVLAANGFEVSSPREQVCCGALHAHAGDLEGARRLARQNIEAFGGAGDANVVTNAGGCGAMLASYGHLLADDEAYSARAREFAERVRDVSQQLEIAGPREGAPLDGAIAVTYDASCHLLHGQRAHTAPLKMFAAIPNLCFVPLEGSDVCCGGAGVYNLLETEMSEKVLGEKLKHTRETGARVLATGNPGCHMQIGAGARLAGLNLHVCHPVEMLDESYRRAGFYVDEE